MKRPLAEYTWKELLEEIQIRMIEHGIVFRKGEPTEENKSQLNIKWEKTNRDRENDKL